MVSKDMTDVSVIICAHNPRHDYFRQVIDALRNQSLSKDRWELLVVDNASSVDLSCRWDLSWHAQARHVREEQLGLTSARMRGVCEASADLLVFVDDDNVPATRYLEAAVRIFRTTGDLGIAGGIVRPEWCDKPPEPWMSDELFSALALRDFGRETLIWKRGSDANHLPWFSPVGAGMVARRAALAGWLNDTSGHILPDRSGSDFASCGDHDIVLHAIRSGWSIGYFPELQSTHLIPARRLESEYLARLSHGIGKSLVQLCYAHGMSNWGPAAPWTIPFRKLRAYFKYRAWAGPKEFISWRWACGNFEGRAAIYRRRMIQRSKTVPKSRQTL